MPTGKTHRSDVVGRCEQPTGNQQPVHESKLSSPAKLLKTTLIISCSRPAITWTASIPTGLKNLKLTVSIDFTKGFTSNSTDSLLVFENMGRRIADALNVDQDFYVALSTGTEQRGKGAEHYGDALG